MDLKVIKVGYLEENCYIITKDKAIVIDPGDEGNKIIDYIRNNNLEMDAILITHHHDDHVGALNSLLDYKKVKVYDIYNLNEGIHDISGFNIEVIYTKGHTNDSVTYYFKDENIMFVGDFIFEGSIGRMDLPTGSINEMKESINKIKKYDKDIIIYPGHGNKTTLGKEIKDNYYFTYFSQ
ncbi:MAG: MBL fold metallo-hydrolase [Bacilli bacterium]|nr:MBL fold metallo-hydrolase [Bacilli bacterium]